MKKARKLITFILTVVMVMSMSMNVWAATITINGGATGSKYSAYKLLNAKDLGKIDGKDKFEYTLNSNYTDILKEVTKETEEAEIIKYISDLDTKEIQEFANAVYAKIKASNKVADKTTTTNELASVDPGYYLIAETALGTGDKVYSLVMLDTAGEEAIQVTTKEELPTLEKIIIDPDNSDNDNISDDGKKNNVSIGSDVKFQLTTKIPEEAAFYDYYFCIFSDTLSTGLTFINDGAKALKVEASVKGTLAEVTDYALYPASDPNAGGNTFKLALINAKDLAGQTITVTYWATLNENAEIGGVTGNTNNADLAYSNDPNIQYGDYKNTDEDTPGLPDPDPEDENGDSLPDIPMGDTPNQVTNTYTTDIKVVKVDENGKALTGATFTLTGEGITKELQVDANGILTFKGLGAGEYTITETDPPEGYNPAADIDVKIVWDGTKDDNAMWTVTVNNAPAGNDFANGVLTLTVENRSGSELPSTGGIGTTIFYIVGGALVLFAVVLLVTKKRMKNEQ